MENNSLNQESDGTRILKAAGILLRLIGFVFIGSAITLAVFGTGITVKETFDEKDQLPLLLMQGFNHLVTFIFLPLIYVFFLKNKSETRFEFKSEKIWMHFVLAGILLMIAVPLINFLAEWNKSIYLPDWGNLKEWLTLSEEKAKKITEVIAIYDNTTEMILVLFVMAVLPAIGEELLFRGIIQNEFRDVLKNHHAAVWITGFIFSFMHLQFFGFFPRMFLGVIFGYLYYWSGNLLVPMFIHFLNNALTLFAMNFYKQGMIETDPESAEFVSPWVIVICLALLAYLLSAFKKYSQKDAEGEINS